MSGEETLVTVLMWCRNVEMSFFREALGSVRSQTSPRWELCIIVDADDPDAPAAIVPEIESCTDSRIFVAENESRLITGAFNTGMRKATTPYVCVLHADDLLDRRAVEILHGYIKQHADVDYFHSSRIYIDDDGVEISDIRRSIDSFTLDDFKNFGPVKHLHCFKVGSALAIGGMDESLGLHGADDYDFPWSMAEAGYTFKAISEPLYYYRDHRRHYRLTTHVPLDAQVNDLVKIWRKHGMTEREIEDQIQRRTAGYLKQALYLDEEDRGRKESEGYDARQGWRQRYGKSGQRAGTRGKR